MLKVIAICLCVALAVGQVTWDNPTKSGNIATVTPSTQGYLVTMTGVGWIASDVLTGLQATSGTVTVIANVNSVAGGNVGVGLTAVGVAGTGCIPADFTTQHPNSAASMLGKAAGTCPSDFLTAYSSSSQAGAQSASALSSTPLAAGKSARWVITPPSTAGSGCNILTFTPPGASGTALAAAANAALNPSNVCASGATTSANQEGYFKANLNYAFYVELETGGTGAVVCFQTAAQFAASAGNCGTALPTTASKAVTFASPTISVANNAKVQTATQGTLVTFTGPAFVTSDVMTDLYSTASTSYTVYTTVVTATGANVGVGITAAGSASGSCTTTVFGTEHATTMLGKAAGTCPSDFLTVYSAAGQSGTQSVDITTAAPLAATKTAKWLVIGPSTVNTGCNTLSYTAPGASAGTVAAAALADFNPAGTCASGVTTSANQQGYFVATKTYAFYAELEASGTAGSVCFQTQAQYTASAGNCGTLSTTSSGSGSGSGTSSAAMISAIMAPIMLVILMFFN